MTPHLEAAAGDYAPTVLLPGDPLRAEWMAQTFLEAPRCVNRIRGELGFTGTYRGLPVSVQSTGMGRSSVAIYVHELIEAYGARTLIRTGSCGGLDAVLGIRTLYIAESVTMEDRIGEPPALPNPTLLAAARACAVRLELPAFFGPMACSDWFYPQPAGRFDHARAAGMLAVDMESEAVLRVGSDLGARTLCACTVVDNPATGELAPMSERQELFTDLARLALETALAAA